MPETTYILLTGLAILGVVMLAALLWQRTRSGKLRRQFGPEYDRTLREAGSRRAAEHELERRIHHVEKAALRELGDEERREFGARWRLVQIDFVDRPKAAVEAADRLVKEVMLARGYPSGRFEQRLADVSVKHGVVVADYRKARELAEKSRHGQASTEELRQSMVCYRSIFQDLLGIEEVPPLEDTTRAHEMRH